MRVELGDKASATSLCRRHFRCATLKAIGVFDVGSHAGLPYKGILWSQKREKPLGFFVVKGILGQKYYESD